MTVGVHGPLAPLAGFDTGGGDSSRFSPLDFEARPRYSSPAIPSYTNIALQDDLKREYDRAIEIIQG